MLVLWGIGAAVALARLLNGICVARRLVASTRTAPHRVQVLARRAAARLGMVRAPRVQLSQAIAAPMLAGCVAPVILMPESLRNLPDSRLMILLAHECEHARRRDTIVALAAGFIRCLHWFDPLVGRVVRRLGEEREIVVDAAVVARLGSASEYAAGLLDVARYRVGRGAAPDWSWEWEIRT